MKKQKVIAHKEMVDTIAVIHITGIVITDLGVMEVDELIQEVLTEMKPPKIILNLYEISYLDSYSFGWISNVNKDVSKLGGELALCCPNQDILYIFKLTDFLRVVPSYYTEKDACEAINTGNRSKRILQI